MSAILSDIKIEEYIKSYNLTLNTLEKIASFITDVTYCRLALYKKIQIVKYWMLTRGVIDDNFSEDLDAN